ncbi:MAG TPA: tetratricopeptide repeat protein [Rhizomicrobium sp.]|nr:tetratricopeptide repeat protein [Rhizomicrobium sp.]
MHRIWRIALLMVTVALPLGICRAADAPADDSSAAFQRGLADNKDGKFEDAIKEFDQAIHLRPDFAEAYEARGRAFEGLKQPERAWSDYDQAVSLKPDFREALADRARVQGSARPVSLIFDLSSGQQPTSAEMFKARGSTYLQKKDYAAAMADFDQAIKLKPSDPDAFRWRGNGYIAMAQYQRALEDFDQAIKLDPQNAEAFNDRGVCYERLGDLQKAASAYKESTKWKPDFALAHNNLGNAYNKMGQYADAIASYSEAIRLKPDYSSAFLNRGNAYRAVLRFQDALVNYNQAIALNPADGEALTARGRLYAQQRRGDLGQDDFSRARDIFDARLRGDPKNRYLQRVRADTDYDAKRHDDAIKDYSSYIALNDNASPLPDADLAHAYLYRGWSRSVRGDNDGALADAEMALRLKPDIPQGKFARAQHLRSLGRYREALKDYDDLIDPKAPQIYFHRAITYFCLGLYKEAEDDMLRFVEIDKHNDKSADVLLHIFRVKRGVADDGFVDGRLPMPQTDWVTEVDGLYRGRQSLSDTEKAMNAIPRGPWKTSPWPCSVKFYLGEYRLEHGDPAGARADLGAISPSNCDWAQAAAAVAEMKRLAAN